MLNTKCLVGSTTLLTQLIHVGSNEYKLVELFNNIITTNHVRSNGYKLVGLFNNIITTNHVRSNEYKPVGLLIT